MKNKTKDDVRKKIKNNNINDYFNNILKRTKNIDDELNMDNDIYDDVDNLIDNNDDNDDSDINIDDDNDNEFDIDLINAEYEPVNELEDFN